MTTEPADDTIDLADEQAAMAAEPPDPSRFYSPAGLGRSPREQTEKVLQDINDQAVWVDKQIRDMEAALALMRLDRQRLDDRRAEYVAAIEALRGDG